MNEKKSEEIMQQVLALEKELKQIKGWTEQPIPIMIDKQGRLAKDLTLKEWFAKLNEEINEVKEVALRSYVTLGAIPGQLETLNISNRQIIAEEISDVIKIMYSMVNQMGIDGDDLDEAMHKCNKKMRWRRCHE